MNCKEGGLCDFVPLYETPNIRTSRCTKCGKDVYEEAPFKEAK